MVFSYLQARLSILPRIFSPVIDATFSTLPFWQRWRLVLLQPVNLLAVLITSPSWLFKNQFSVIFVPTRNDKRRCLVYQPKRHDNGRGSKLQPLHINIHGGGWIGGIPEQDSRFCSLLADKTGAVVVSITYRIAPRHIYPAAHNDTEEIVLWLIQHAAELGADSGVITIGGSSVGATLALSACQFLHSNPITRGDGERCLPLAFIGICPALDFRQRPDEKPRPPNFPTSDPLAFLVPMFDVYGGTHRSKHISDSRLHPILMDMKMLPQNVLVVAAGIDILLQEALHFVDRARNDCTDKEIDMMVVEQGFHGFMELPSFILEKERLEVFDKVVKLIIEVHKSAGVQNRLF